MACQEEQTEKRIGMLAGWGNYPVRVAQALKDAGYSVYCLGVKGHCKSEAELREICADFSWTTLGKFGKSIRYFQSHSVGAVRSAAGLGNRQDFCRLFSV